MHAALCILLSAERREPAHLRYLSPAAFLRVPAAFEVPAHRTSGRTPWAGVNIWPEWFTVRCTSLDAALLSSSVRNLPTEPTPIR